MAKRSKGKRRRAAKAKRRAEADVTRKGKLTAKTKEKIQGKKTGSPLYLAAMQRKAGTAGKTKAEIQKKEARGKVKIPSNPPTQMEIRLLKQRDKCRATGDSLAIEVDRFLAGKGDERSLKKAVSNYAKAESWGGPALSWAGRGRYDLPKWPAAAPSGLSDAGGWTEGGPIGKTKNPAKPSIEHALVALHTPEAYEILGPMIRPKPNSWTRGGCCVFAMALQEYLGRGELMMIVRENRVVHVVLKVGSKYVDAKGLHTKTNLLGDWDTPSSCAQMMKFNARAAKRSEIKCPKPTKIVLFLRESQADAQRMRQYSREAIKIYKRHGALENPRTPEPSRMTRMAILAMRAKRKSGLRLSPADMQSLRKIKGRLEGELEVSMLYGYPQERENMRYALQQVDHLMRKDNPRSKMRRKNPYDDYGEEEVEEIPNWYPIPGLDRPEKFGRWKLIYARSAGDDPENKASSFRFYDYQDIHWNAGLASGRKKKIPLDTTLQRVRPGADPLESGDKSLIIQKKWDGTVDVFEIEKRRRYKTNVYGDGTRQRVLLSAPDTRELRRAKGKASGRSPREIVKMAVAWSSGKSAPGLRTIKHDPKWKSAWHVPPPDEEYISYQGKKFLGRSDPHFKKVLTKKQKIAKLRKEIEREERALRDPRARKPLDRNPKRKSAKKKAARRKTPPYQLLINRCQKLWTHYCERPSKKRLEAIYVHLDKMKESKSKKVAEERRRCLRAANAEAKKLGYKR